jgi:hypothetical protein
LAIGHEIKGYYTIAYSLGGLARTAYSRGDLDRAHSLYKEALQIFQESANHWNVTYCLEAFAALAVAHGEMERAARLFGATADFYRHLQFLLSPLERQQHEHDLAAARAALGEKSFSAFWAEGHAMTMKQAVDYALQE